MTSLVAAWRDAISSFCETVAAVPDEDLSRPSLLPGWTVADIVAHIAALEWELSGQPLPDHVPDWDALPHADDLFSSYTEIGVDVRRGWTPAVLRADLADAVAARTEQLLAGSQDEDAKVSGVGGLPRTLGEQLRMRCFDIVLHEIDVRDALEMPAPDLGEGARVCATQIAQALGYVWVKRAGALPGQVLRMLVPPWLDVWIGVGPDGRGMPVEPGDAAVTVTAAPLEFLRLGSGRRGNAAACDLEGDEDLGRRLLAGLNIAP